LQGNLWDAMEAGPSRLSLAPKIAQCTYTSWESAALSWVAWLR
jgi:hypothetical protein